MNVLNAEEARFQSITADFLNKISILIQTCSVFEKLNAA
ncbi:hypothetical protein NBRC111894_1978 [Sporolactobacillus inulinus]|uniref:Uncharacterized protein n=1 Tax=Sporolactobacillus inulinus TaxID=2078 RepID=A0A4Y1ZBP5_9BACL|nr:hypothetical protein NBRC111894_1978 [Sporolactobacillus inulinus]